MNAVVYLGLAIFILGGIGLLIAAFRTSVLWGLICIIIAPASILYTVMHWHDAKNPFLLQLCGVVLLLVGAYSTGSLP